MKDLKSFICEKLNQKIKEGETLINVSNGEIWGTNRYTKKYLDVEAIEKDYLTIEKECKNLQYNNYQGDLTNWDEITRKLTGIIMCQVKYSKNWKKMEDEISQIAEKYSSIGVFKVSIMEVVDAGGWDDISGNIDISIKFNRAAELHFTIYPKGYEYVRNGLKHPKDLTWFGGSGSVRV